MDTLKSLKKLTSLTVILALLFLCSPYALAVDFASLSEKKKEISKTFKVSLSDALNIENRYGNITVSHWSKNEIEIKVVIEARANNDRRVEELLGYVNISLDQSGNMVKGSTSMKKFGGTRNNERLIVNYYISKPSKVKTHLEQRYGNINLPKENDALTQLVVKYGNINGGDFSEKLDIECSYGNITVGNLKDSSMELAYCGDVKIKNGRNLDIESRYSNAKLADVEGLNLEVSYGNFTVDRIIKSSIVARYSNVTILYLEKNLNTEIAYGTIDINETSSDFKQINVEARYGNLKVRIPLKTSFNVTAEQMKYANYDISGQFNVQTTKDKDDGVSYYSQINNGNSDRKIYFEGNKYSNLTINPVK